MAETPRNDITINGGGTIAAGSYENVTINGGGTVSGDIVCTKLRINGATTLTGSVKAAAITVNGTATFNGPVQVNEMAVNGDSSLHAGLGVGSLIARGTLTVDAGIAARDIEAKGVLRVRGDVSTGTFRGEGTLEAEAVTADTFDLMVYGPSKVKSIEAARVTVRAPGSLAAVIFWAEKRLTAESIRASEVWAEHTSANLVSAGNATIGRESRVGLVQYSGTYSAVDDAVVTEAVKAEPA
jgi:cytoskeletal protein CcmA (bactofilin family)